MAAAREHYRLVKSIALDSRCLRSGLAARGAGEHVLHWIDRFIARWSDALSGDPWPSYLSESGCSHVLDLEDDLHGQSCTPTTLNRVDWLLAALAGHYSELVAHAAFFWGDRQRSHDELRSAYQFKRKRPLEMQLGGPTSAGS